MRFNRRIKYFCDFVADDLDNYEVPSKKQFAIFVIFAVFIVCNIYFGCIILPHSLMGAVYFTIVNVIAIFTTVYAVIYHDFNVSQRKRRSNLNSSKKPTRRTITFK